MNNSSEVQNQLIEKIASTTYLKNKLRIQFKKLANDYISTQFNNNNDLKTAFENIRNPNDATSDKGIQTILKWHQNNNLNGDNEYNEKNLKKSVDRLLFYFNLSKYNPLHFFGTSLKYLTNSKYRAATSENFIKSFNINRGKPEIEADLKKANRIFLAAVIADVSFGLGIVLTVAGLFFPPLIVPGIILLTAGLTIHAYLDIEYHQSQKQNKNKCKDNEGSTYLTLQQNGLGSEHKNEQDEDDEYSSTYSEEVSINSDNSHDDNQSIYSEDDDSLIYSQRATIHSEKSAEPDIQATEEPLISGEGWDKNCNKGEKIKRVWR